MELTVLTTTYNRCELLKKLYCTLKGQNCKDFTWLIIDDGSHDNTESIVSEWARQEKDFLIRYIKKQNGGKSRAVNLGLNESSNVDFVLIIDDDEILYPNAISIVHKYINQYINTACVGIEFLRNGENGSPIANYTPNEDFFMSVQERKKKNLEIDGYAGYFIKKIGEKRFPEFANERYVGPGVLQMLVSKDYKLLWPNAVLGETEYLQGGITKQGRKLRIKNPKGMVIYCCLMQTHDAGFAIRFKYSIMGYAYMSFIKRSDPDLVYENYIKSFVKIGYLPGKILGYYWGKKYKDR